jgi:hypothetical protein
MRHAASGAFNLPTPALPRRGPDDAKTGLSARIPRGLKRQLDAIATLRGIDMSEVVVEFLRWALEEWRRSNPEPGAPKIKK